MFPFFFFFFFKHKSKFWAYATYTENVTYLKHVYYSYCLGNRKYCPFFFLSSSSFLWYTNLRYLHRMSKNFQYSFFYALSICFQMRLSLAYHVIVISFYLSVWFPCLILTFMVTNSKTNIVFYTVSPPPPPPSHKKQQQLQKRNVKYRMNITCELWMEYMLGIRVATVINSMDESNRSNFL